jgi:Domain of unknown function (DUF4124)
LIGIFFMFLTLSAQAQVNKCVNPKTGVVTYSDTLCDTQQKSTLLESRKTNEELMMIQMQADAANERKYREQYTEAEQRRPAARQLSEQSIAKTDKSTTIECERAKKEHETVSTIMSGSAEQRRARFNAATVKVNSACGMTTELIQEPVKKTIIINDSNNRAGIVRCDRGFCYDDRGGVHPRY